ncbi:MAG: hypothetical protein WCV50_00430 [Patescibacteria group bacterium]|jgi:hypothetical protein
MNFLLFDPVTLFNSLPSTSNPLSAMVFIFLKGGWIFVLAVIFWGLWEAYKEYIRNRYDSSLKFVLLAIDIPKNNEQSPKAVEHIFSHLYGIKKSGNLKDKYIKGYTQPSFSLEIVSIEGYIQFLIRTPVKFRDLVEAAVYAQYPDAEITEVEDYVDMIPKPLEFYHPKYDIWGTEFKLQNTDLYPIRTYPLFEHSLSQKLMDPMASILEIMSRMGPGESLWIQIIIAPVGEEWRKKGLALINKLIGKKSDKKGVDLMYFPREIGRGLSESFTATFVPTTEMGEQKQKKEREWPSMMQHLSPQEKEVVEAVGMKIGKLGFKTKIRYIYSAPKDRFNKSKGTYAINGAFAQFTSQNLNGFVVNKKTRTKIDYYFIKTRLLGRIRRILWGYRYRSMKRGRPGFVLNIEELATLWHFPQIDIKVPSVQTVDARKSTPPMGLPMEEESVFSKQPSKPASGKPTSTAEPKGTPPVNLPFA